ncbi:MAG: prolyl oligopeptidase family serine peptidase, partial [Gemmatimonadetes bacterium]|nr:prolyl oligopeptidase family serine peptidase [Gemmatimonadota bacterium]
MRPSRSSLRRLVASVPLALTLAAAVPAAAGSSAPPVPASVPETRTVDHVDDYAGVEVKDPYRWLEAMDDVEVRRWIDAQRTATADWIADVPERAAVVRRLESLMDHEDRSVPVRHGDRTFQSRQEGLANQRVLWVTDADGSERPLIDPNAWSADGTIALREVSYRRDGRLIAIGKSEGGSDWRTLHVVDVDTGRELPDVLRWVKFSSPEWANDGESFYYGRYPTPEGDAFSSVNENQRLYLHRLGTDQSEDELVLEAPPEHPEWGFDPTVTEDRRWLVVSIWAGSGRQNAVWVRDLTRNDGEFVRLFDDFDADRSLVTSRGDELWFRTDEDAPRQRILAIEPATGRRRDVLPEGRGVLQSARIVSDRLVTVSLEDVSSKLRVWTLEGDLVREVQLPTLGTVGGVSARESDSDFFFTFQSFTFPGSIYRHDVRTGATELTWKPDLDLDSERWTSEQVRYESRDGTSVPMFLVRDRDQARDGRNPVYLYGYGGFRLSMKPSFSASRIVWLEMGGIYAVANLRGGGEFGEEWHATGMLDKKQNVFD